MICHSILIQIETSEEIKDLHKINGDELSSEQIGNLKQLLKECDLIFVHHKHDFGRTALVQHWK